MKIKLLSLLSILLLFTGCNKETNINNKTEPTGSLPNAVTEAVADTEPTSESSCILSYNNTENALLIAKIKELDGTLITGCNYGDSEDDILAAIAYGTAPSVDIWRFTENREEFVMPISGMVSSTYGIHEENGVKFLVICGYAPGLACPATVISVIDGEIVVSSEYTDEASSPNLLYYCYANGADLICDRGIGISIGSHNVIPYYWDSVDNKYKPYDLTEIGIDEVKELDKNNVVPDIDTAISAYKRENGLIHVNYDNITEASFGEEHIASRTFVIENNCLRPFDEHSDMKYGFFLQALTVTE